MTTLHTASVHTSPRFALVNLGCKVNRVEADRIEFDLTSRGLIKSIPEEADLIVINTCAVTGEAETKARKAVRQACKQPRNPWVVVTGCAASLHHDIYASLGEKVLISIDKDRVLDTSLEVLGMTNTSPLSDNGCSAVSWGSEMSARRLGIKVQDGCDNRCTYCIVWKARGQARSIDADIVLEQVDQACKLGVQEIVLTGINLGSYRDGTTTLAGLTQRILDATTVARIRLSSIEPLDVTDELLTVMAAYPTRIAQHLHIPLQSGSDRILRKMDRLYTVDEFMNRVGAARNALPALALSTDIICGFPGESDEDFDQTMQVAQACQFAKIHVFRFSARPSTPAASMPLQLDPQVIAERARQLRALSLKLRVQDAQKRVGHHEQVLIETITPAVQGTSNSYHRVQLIDSGADSSDKISAGDLVDTFFLSSDSTGLITGCLRP